MKIKVSAIAEAVSAMKQASDFIGQQPGVRGEGEIRYSLLKCACRLGSYLDVIEMEIEKGEHS